MGFNAFSYGANAICFMKNNQKYGMICAWAMQVDYDKVLLLLGAQSETGRAIEKGDIIGVSVLNHNQEDIVNTLGEHHSLAVDKFLNLDYIINDSAIIMKDATNTMVVEVIEILHLKGIEEDHLIYGLIKSHESNNLPKYAL